VKQAAALALDEDEELRPLLADLFHALNQPLTALRCALELALSKPLTVEESRSVIQMALERAESAARLATAIRALIEAGDPGEEAREVLFANYLREAVADMRPVAEARGIALTVEGWSASQVCFEARRLRQALFYLLDFLVGGSGDGATIHLRLATIGGFLVLSVHSDGRAAEGWRPGRKKNSETAVIGADLQLALARRMFEAAGGSWKMGKDRGTEIEVSLPLAGMAPGQGFPSPVLPA